MLKAPRAKTLRHDYPCPCKDWGVFRVIHRDSRSDERVLRYVDRDGDDLILYEPSAAAQAKTILALAESISNWGDLRQVRETHLSELVDPIVQYLWEKWQNKDERDWVFKLDDEAVAEELADTPRVQNWEQFLTAFPDDRALSVPTVNEDGEPIFMDPFDSTVMGVPPELYEYYVEQSTMVSMWWSAQSEDLPSIRHDAEELGWRVEEGRYDDFPHYS